MRRKDDSAGGDQSARTAPRGRGGGGPGTPGGGPPVMRRKDDSAVDDQSACTALRGRGQRHLGWIRSSSSNLPELGSTLVAEKSTMAARQNGRHPTTAMVNVGASYCENTTPNGMQLTASGSMLDRAGAKSEREQLSGGDTPVWAPREPAHLGVEGAPPPLLVPLPGYSDAKGPEPLI